MKKILLLMATMIILCLTLYAILLIYVVNKSQVDNRAKSDVILVLGGKAYSGGDCYGPICQQGFVPKVHLNPCLVARVKQAVSLYQKKFAPKILVSGGTDKEDGKNEAEAMQKIAITAGVPSKDILMEKESGSTYENLVFSKRILGGKGLNSIIIVSDPYHNARAGLVAAKLGYQYSLSPTRSLPYCSHTDDYLIKEPLAILWYKLLNRI